MKDVTYLHAFRPVLSLVYMQKAPKVNLLVGKYIIAYSGPTATYRLAAAYHTRKNKGEKEKRKMGERRSPVSL